jgi:hypothetical protein
LNIEISPYRFLIGQECSDARLARGQT